MTITPVMLLGAVALMSLAESLFSVARGALLKVGVVALFAVPAYMAYSKGGLGLPSISALTASASQAAGSPSRNQAESPPVRQARTAQPERDWAPAPQARLRAEPGQAQPSGRQAYGQPAYGHPAQAAEADDDLDEVPELQGRNRFDRGRMRPNPFDQHGYDRGGYDRRGYGAGYDEPRPRRIEDWDADGYGARPRQGPQAPIDITDARAVRRVLEELRTGR